MEFMMAQSFEDSARTVWKTISDFGGISRYATSVTESVADGNEPGSYRTLTVAGETPVRYRERLETIDHEDMRFTYSMPDASLFPMQDGYRATMHISPRGEHCCLLTWSAMVEPRNVSPSEVTGFLATVYQSVFDGLRTLHP